ncbi:hypothetical protein GCM10023340_00420 [Nocardioides marinquilinus]|uniref:Cell division protein CrgA n=1 Tax=Nocardioides marinquilinus TaxID=1210400 RepID=A0ABP9P3X2_9ACTN
MAKLKPKQRETFDPDRGPIMSARFAIALVLMVLGIAWIVFYYVQVRPAGGFDSSGVPLTGDNLPSVDENGDPVKGSPAILFDLAGWNYLIGFGLFFLGLIVAAHPATPLGRGRGVVVGMLGCFLLGLAWICIFYAIAQDTSRLPVFNDLDQKNLFVGIAFMAVGFTFATRWE